MLVQSRIPFSHATHVNRCTKDGPHAGGGGTFNLSTQEAGGSRTARAMQKTPVSGERERTREREERKKEKEGKEMGKIQGTGISKGMMQMGRWLGCSDCRDFSECARLSLFF